MNLVKEKRHLKRIFKKALKIGIGSGLAIAMAHFLGLKNEIFAGTITLLTILTTKWETIKLTLYRAVTFVFSVLVCWLVFNHLGGGWAEYGVFLIVMILFCECMGWGATISVNAVIGAHFFTEADFSIGFITNEFLLLAIGVSIAVILSLFNNNRGSKREVVRHIFDFMSESIGKMNALDLQIKKLESVLAHMKLEKLPESREEFENRAVLYPVLMDIEDFLLIKKSFVDELDDRHKNETFIK